MGLDRNSKSKLIRAITEDLFHHESIVRDELLVDGVKRHRVAPFAVSAFIASLERKKRAAPVEEQQVEKRLLALPVRDYSDLRIARTDITERGSRQRSLLDVAQVDEEVAEAIAFCRERGCDSLAIGLQRAEIPNLIISKIGDLQTANITVAFFLTDGVKSNGEKATAGIHGSYGDAVSALMRQEVPKRYFGYINIWMVPGVYGNISFIEPAADALNFHTETPGMVNFFTEFEKFTRWDRGNKFILRINAPEVPNRFLSRCMYLVENAGGFCHFHLPRLLPDADFDFQVAERAHKTLAQAVAAINATPPAPPIEASSYRWRVFNRPAFDRRLGAYVIEGMQKNEAVPEARPDSDQLDIELIALEQVKKHCLLIKLGSFPASRHLVERLRHGIGAALERKGGLLVVQSSDPTFVRENTRLTSPIVYGARDVEVKKHIERHYPIAPPTARWVYLDRPQLIAGTSKLIESAINPRASLDWAEGAGMWEHLDKEFTEIAISDALALFLELPGDRMAEAGVNFLRNMQREFRDYGNDLYFVARSRELRDQIRSFVDTLPRLHKRQPEALLERASDLRPGRSGWELFQFDAVQERRMIVRVQFTDSSEGITTVFGVGRDRAKFYDEIHAMAASNPDYVFVLPQSLTRRQILEQKPIIWAIEELSKSGHAVAGVHSSRDLLRACGFETGHQFTAFDDAVKKLAARWK